MQLWAVVFLLTTANSPYMFRTLMMGAESVRNV